MFSVLWGKGKETSFSSNQLLFPQGVKYQYSLKLKWCEILGYQLWAQEEGRTRQWAEIRGEPRRAGHLKDVTSCKGGEGRAGRRSVTVLPSQGQPGPSLSARLVLHTCCFFHPNAFPSLRQESSSFKSQSNGLFSKSSLVPQPGLNLCVLGSHETSDAPHSSLPLITSSSI